MVVGQRRTNSFTAVRGDNMAMRPFAKLLWTLVAVGQTCYSKVLLEVVYHSGLSFRT